MAVWVRAVVVCVGREPVLRLSPPNPAPRATRHSHWEGGLPELARCAPGVRFANELNQVDGASKECSQDCMAKVRVRLARPIGAIRAAGPWGFRKRDFAARSVARRIRKVGQRNQFLFYIRSRLRPLLTGIAPSDNHEFV